MIAAILFLSGIAFVLYILIGYPLLLALFEKRATGAMDSTQLAQCIEMLRGFILRRFVCGESSRGYGQLFVRALGKNTCPSCFLAPHRYGRASAGRQKMALFEAEHLSKRFGDRVVLEDISLRFEQGQLSGIMGPNGAGKSTCFNVLTGHFPPDRGRVLLAGEDITGISPANRAQRHCSLVSDH